MLDELRALQSEGFVKLPRNFPGVLIGLLLVLVVISRGVPHSLLTGYSYGVIGPAIALVVVVAFAIALALDRSSPKKPRQSRPRDRTRR